MADWPFSLMISYRDKHTMFFDYGTPPKVCEPSPQPSPLPGRSFPSLLPLERKVPLPFRIGRTCQAALAALTVHVVTTRWNGMEWQQHAAEKSTDQLIFGGSEWFQPALFTTQIPLNRSESISSTGYPNSWRVYNVGLRAAGAGLEELQTSSGPWQSLHQMINQNIVFNCQNNVKSFISLSENHMQINFN